MNNKLLGAIALLGAPFLLIGYIVEMSYTQMEDSWFTGVWGFIYITAWLCSIVVLQKSKATGDNQFGKVLLWIILVTLSVANISNMYQWAMPDNKPPFFFYIDMCWPLSNLIMLVVGITIVRAKKITGTKRFIPLVVGFWFPVSIGALIMLGKNNFSMMIGGIYSAGAWIALALMISRLPERLKIRSS